MRMFFSALLLLAVCCFKFGLADLEEFPDPPLEVVEEGHFIGLDTLEFWHSKLALPSSFFPELPERLAAWLDEKQYRIAQPHVYEYFGTWKEARPANCVQGNFDGDGPDDWAMIIECQGELYLGIFWDGEPEQGRMFDLKYFGEGNCKCNYFEGKGIYNGYFVHLVSVSEQELNDMREALEEKGIYGYWFERDGIWLYGDHCYTDRNGDNFPMLYWNGIDWQAYGTGDDGAYYPGYTNLEWTKIREDASLPLIDMVIDFDQDTLCLPPAYFVEIPVQLRTWLEQKQYRIPQVHDLYMEHFTEGMPKHLVYNVASGNFNGKGEQDWVFVTFKEDTLRAFVCWDSNVSSIEQLDLSEFSLRGYSWCRVLDKKVTTFKIFLKKVGEASLNSFDISFPPCKILPACCDQDNMSFPSSFMHDGIHFDSGGDMWNGGFIRYYHNGKWFCF